MTWVFIWALGRALPPSMSARLIHALIPIALRRGLIDASVLRENLRAVTANLSDAELDALIVANVRSYGRYWAELFELASRRKSLLLEKVVIHREATLTDALGLGRGAVIALPHMANWDLAGAWLAQHHEVVTVAERIQPTRLFKIFMNLRTGLGMNVIPLDSGTATLKRLRESIHAGAAVCLVADRVVGGATGIPVRFAGGTTSLPAGPALLAYETGAPLLPVGLWYAGRAMHIEFRNPIPVDSAAARRDVVRDVTQRLADEFSDVLARNPQDWRALQPVWEQAGADA